MEDAAAAQSAQPANRVRIAQVVGLRAVQHQSRVRGQAVGRAHGSQPAHLIQGGKHKIRIAGHIGVQQPEQVMAAHPAIQSLAPQPVFAKGDAARGKGNRRAHGRLGHGLVLIPGPNIHIQFANGQHMLAVLGGLQVNGHGSDYAVQRLAALLGIAYPHPLADQHTGIHVANGPHPQKPLLRGGNDHQARLVHVGANHFARGGGVAAGFVGNDIAHLINGYRFFAQSIPAGLQHGLAHQFLPAAYAGQIA